MSSSCNAVPVVLEKHEEEAAPPPEWLAWGTSPKMYLSYGMVAKKGMAPALTDAVAAAPSFTVLSPPMGLDFFAVLDGRGLGAANAGDEPVRLLSLLQNAIAEQINMELFSKDPPRFGDATSRSRGDVMAWWATSLKEAFPAFHNEAATCSHGEPGMDAGAKALVTLVLEKYLVIGNCGGGGSKVVLCRDGGELVELSSEHMANNSRGDDENKKGVHKASEDHVTKAAAKGIVVDVVAVEREAQDEFMIVGTAALWDKVTPAAACAHVRRRLGRTSPATMPGETRITDAQGSPALLAAELARKAVHAGSQSNVSVGLVVFRDFWAAGHAPQAAANK